MEAMGAYIRRLRDEKDLSLREFAKKLDCSAAFVSDVELGRRHPSEKVLSDMARILDVSLEEIKAHDTRPPVEDIKRITLKDPRFAAAFRTVIDKKISAEELIEMVEKLKGRGQHKAKK